MSDPKIPARHLDVRVCTTCGREFHWRKKWARCWDSVKYCSKACRGGPDATDRALEQAVIELLSSRRRDASICPSEAARRVAVEHDVPDWRTLMEPARRAGRRLTAAGQVEVTQQGRVVEPSRARGPIRLRLTSR